MKILLLGMNGQLGWELQRSLAPLGELLALDRKGFAAGPADFNRPLELAASVRAIAPQIIVNAAAFTAVDRAEAESALARRVNAEAVSALAHEAAALGAWLVHYSTDYVFDGSGSTPWHEDAPTGPLSVYGQTKLEGEQAIRTSGCKHLLLRTGWVHSPRGTNFRATASSGLRESSRISMSWTTSSAHPPGPIWSPTSRPTCCATPCSQPQLGGTYHVAAGGETSRHAYACHIVELPRRAGRPRC